MKIIALQEDPMSRLLSTIHPFVRQCGNDRRGRWHLRNRRLLDYLLVYVKEGYGVFSLDGKSHVVHEGDLFWFPPGRLCSMEGTSTTMISPFVHFDLIFRDPQSYWEGVIPENTTNFSKDDKRMHPPLPANSPFNVLGGHMVLQQPDYICSLIESICHDAALMRPLHQFEQSGKMRLLLAAILRESMSSSTTKGVLFEKMQKIPEFIKQHIDIMSVDVCAQRCGISESYFRKVFIQMFNISFQEYVVKMKIRYATELMSNPALSISQISKKCGYSTAQNFARSFSKIMGIPPSGYRRGLLSYTYTDNANIP